LLLQEAEPAVEEGPSVASMVTARQATEMQIAKVTVLMKFLPP
jgi:hypothetical protein